MSNERVVPRDMDARQVALLAGAFVLVLVVTWFLFLRGGGITAPESSAPPADLVVQAEPPPADVPELSGKPGQGPVETFEVFAPKDPFEPLVGARSATDADGDSESTRAATEGGAPAPGSASSGENVAGHTVRLVDVFEDNGKTRAQVQVDGTVYTVDEGETFAESFKLLSVSGECASMLYGDDQFTLCEGEEILK